MLPKQYKDLPWKNLYYIFWGITEKPDASSEQSETSKMDFCKNC